MIHTGSVLDLGDDFNILAAVAVKEFTQIPGILRCGYERSRHKVHMIADAEQQIFLILFGKVRTGHDLIGETHALLVAEHAAGNHRADHIGIGQLSDGENHHAVVDSHLIAHRKISGKILIVD